MKVVINTKFGGFGLSDKAISRLLELGYEKDLNGDWDCMDRTSPFLIQVVEELGEGANGRHARLKIVDISNEYKDNWHIHNYDGSEHIVQDHVTWS